ncbi:MAG: HAMP domain-containing histidine kinase [Eubacterium sp.]|nr:HAMP domain-containing histidine kinase [Eubacterium sp.]
MNRKVKPKIKRAGRGSYIIMSLGPILALIVAVAILLLMEITQIKATYSLNDSGFESPYVLFDKVYLLDNLTTSDFQELQDVSMRNSKLFTTKTWQARENARLNNKYSFLVVILDNKIVYTGDSVVYDKLYQTIREQSDGLASKNAMYYGKDAKNYLIKKIGFVTPKGKRGSACIVTRTDVTLPHIVMFTIMLVALLIIVTILVVVAFAGYNYYFILRPIRQLQTAVMNIRKGELSEGLEIVRESEFSDLYQEFEDMRIELKESIEERNRVDSFTKEVIGNITHDLKTPLTAITGYSEGILDGVASTPDRLEKYIKTIHSKSVDMALLVDELSYFTKIYQKEESFNYSMENVQRFYSDCVSDLSLDMETRDIQLIYQSFIDGDIIVKIDRDKIKRVINNIVGNALKYMDSDNGIIRFRITKEGDKVVMAIRDNGRGIEQEELPYIFERFYRTDSSRNSKTGGSGLGLAIAKKIIDEHGGEIWAESEFGKGTTVLFSVPIINED